MHNHLKATHGAMTNSIGLSVIRAVLTRWTSHYLAYRRLYELRHALQGLADTDSRRPEDERVVIFGDANSKRKARLMVGIIQDPSFWAAVGR